MDWIVLLELQGNTMDTNTDRMADYTTGYINLCRNIVIPAGCWPNNKLWNTSDIKALLTQNKEAF